MKIYGIKNCDTVRKALKWLNEHKLSYEFHDFKKSGVTKDKLEEWSTAFGWEVLLNKRGTTWKQLDPETQDLIKTKADAFKLMQEKTSLIKRPVIESNQKTLIGFDEVSYNALLD